MLAESVRIVEVGPRDGLQNIKDTVPTATKIELINGLAQTGLRTIEATSFVSPRWVPQLSDAKAVMESMKLSVDKEDISFPVLVPNLKGLEAAAALDVKEIGIFLSATDGFSHCPYDGRTSPSTVLAMAKKMLEMGCFEISLGDTTGTATPKDIRHLLEVLLAEITASKLAGHFHDSFGQAIANVKEAFSMGIRAFDSSVGGLGGCPYSPGAKGNVATEDVVYLFENMGISTGVDLAKLAKVGTWITQQLHVPNGSQISTVLGASNDRAMEIKSNITQPAKNPAEWQTLPSLVC
ncbi:pyruvate carboxyltransferase [Aureobasidium subglaciale]|nr:pyruvate carboxyltransferase [Aureobasidium subglaciale]